MCLNTSAQSTPPPCGVVKIKAQFIIARAGSFSGNRGGTMASIIRNSYLFLSFLTCLGQFSAVIFIISNNKWSIALNSPDNDMEAGISN